MGTSWHQFRRLLGIFILAFTGLAGALTLGGAAAAHHPVLESQTERPCGDDAPWTATVTARSDQDWNKDWSSRYQIDGGVLTDWSALSDDQVPYEFEIGPFDASVDSATVRVESNWYLKSDGSLSVTADRSITIARPDSWDCLNTVTPGTPAVTYDCATEQLVIIGADDTDSVDYTVTINQAPNGEGSTWDVTITATPQPGHEFAPDATTEWNFTGTVDCLNTVTPGTPAVTYDCATEQLVIIGADDTDSVDYTVTINQAPNGEGSTWDVTITATPQPGHEFAPDATTEWNFTGTVDCLNTVTPGTPAVTYDCATEQLVIIGADDTDSVDYTVTINQAPNGEGSTWDVTITATPQPGHEFAPDATTEWNFTGTVDCLNTVTPGTPAVTYDCATEQLVIIGADDTDSVDYTVTINQAPNGEGSTWDVTITATPQPGHEFAPDATTEWNFTGTVDCLNTVTPGTPAVTYDCATEQLVIIGADDTDSVDYTVTINQAPNGEGSTWDVTITATPQPGHEFAPDATTEWNFTGTVDCLNTVTPATPQLVCRLPPESGLALQVAPSETFSYQVSGSLDVSEGEAYDVTVVALPAAGYEFPVDATTEWNFTGVVTCQDSITPTTTTTTMVPPSGSTTTTTTTVPPSGSTTTTTTTVPPSGSTTTTTTTVPPSGSTTTTTTPTGTAITGSSSTALLMAYGAVMTLLGALLMLIKRSFRPVTD